jgi:hypothetical protein
MCSESPRPKHDPTQMTPEVCGNALQAALNTSDTVNPNVIARAVRQLCRWLTATHRCFERKVRRLEGNTPDNTCFLALVERVTQLEAGYGLSKSVKKLEDQVNRIQSSVDRDEVKLEAVARRLQAHIRGDVDTPFGTLHGPGPLMHEEHPHKNPIEELCESEVMKQVCPTVPMGLERPKPRFCHQCGVKL